MTEINKKMWSNAKWVAFFLMGLVALYNLGVKTMIWLFIGFYGSALLVYLILKFFNAIGLYVVTVKPVELREVAAPEQEKQ
ncbi:MAG: hypothetical protein HOO97_08750 [Sideroxydans sp.]|nr:hypothetical protein [Sideroxydans sp.]